MAFALFSSQARSPVAQQTRRWIGWGRGLLAIYVTLQVALLMVLVLDHVGCPVSLEPWEGAVVAQFQRLWEGQSLYPAPSAQFVPLVYNRCFIT
jgi:hypothetical protein